MRGFNSGLLWVLLIGCGANPPATTYEFLSDSMAVARREVSVRQASSSKFTPPVAALEAEGTCSGPVQIPGRPGSSYSLSLATTPSRRFGVQIGDQGEVISLTDRRGPEGGFDDDVPTADVTRVFVGLRDELVIVENRPIDGEAEAFSRPLKAALDAPQLGCPQSGIDRVLRECASGGPDQA